MQKIRTILADDHTLIRVCLTAILGQSADLEIIAEAATGSEAVRLCRELQPDLLIMDFGRSEPSGAEATRDILACSPATKVLILSVNTDRRYVSEALKAGAAGFLLKNCPSTEIFAGIASVMRGEVYLSEASRGVLEKGEPGLPAAPRHEEVLTPREVEVLVLLAEGKGARDIAELLEISPKTVETHRMHVMKKLKVANIASLTKYAIRVGLLQLD